MATRPDTFIARLDVRSNGICPNGSVVHLSGRRARMMRWGRWVKVSCTTSKVLGYASDEDARAAQAELSDRS